ncbi:hypothetical protein Poli38472_008863 [Pythium oligandrum]|uniref:FYVE-type domain-containing protein n=1 Tax=Pythium oligandrum TaxID=41045 RepID=A0A8K1C4D4_PYTOL|nr:hypothetical protein Poli38472_008863 [Pythium oligandrum]|eukprot:TMW56215.1 hypothetical protein Poli38472_008863 [Pythium oligandrum]
MDRFLIDDVEEEYDALEPLRPSSFDMSFTLSSSSDARHRVLKNAMHEEMDRRGANSSRLSHASSTSDDFAPASSAADSRRNAAEGAGEGHFAAFDAEINSLSKEMDGAKLKKMTSTIKNTTSIAEKLEERAQDAIQVTSLVGDMSWRLVKRMQDIHVYKPGKVSVEDSNKVIFRISCEVKASLGTIMEYLAPRDSKKYADIESQVYPGLLHASVIKKMEIPPSSFDGTASGGELNDHSSPHSETSTGSIDAMDPFPRLNVKWHASKFAGRFAKPVDFFFIEYSNIDKLPDGRKRGYGYLRSVESFKGDELATRLNSEKVTIPQSVSKCKRAVINKGIFTVTPMDTNTATGMYEVMMMMVIDFQDEFSVSIGQRIVNNFTARLTGIRELLFKTLFQPVNLISRADWKDENATHCIICKGQFSLMKPRHHCRSCGEAVCGTCSRKWVVQPGEKRANDTRLCTSCSLRARSILRVDPATFNNDESPSSGLLSSSQVGSFSTRAAASAVHGRTPTPLHASAIQPQSRLVASARTHGTNESASDVKVASVLTSEADTEKAAMTAFDMLVNELGGQAPHFMMVSYSYAHDADMLYRTLADSAPDTLFMGGTSNAGVFTEAGAMDTGTVLGLWGIYDPEGSYAVLNADLALETPRDATRRCILDGMRMLCLGKEESPDFVWMNLASGSEEVVVKTLNEVADCAFTVVGGGSYSPPSSGPHRATQICSEGASVGCVTSHGAVFAICVPSVEVTHAYFSCYEPTDKTFTATKAMGRDVYSLDKKPALKALNDSVHGLLHEFVVQPQKFNVDNSKLPLFYPLGRKCHDSRTAKFSRHQVIQPFKAGPDCSLNVGCEVRSGEKLRVMSISAENVEERIAAGFREALKSSIPVMQPANITGCLLNVSANYPMMLQNETLVVARATTRAFKHSSIMGSVSEGQQGVLLCTNEAVHSNAMVSALLITNRKKAIKLNPLRSQQTRRFSTY